MPAYSKIPAPPAWMIDVQDLDLMQHQANATSNDYREMLIENYDQQMKIQNDKERKESEYQQALDAAYQEAMEKTGGQLGEMDFLNIQSKAAGLVGDTEQQLKIEENKFKYARQAAKQAATERQKAAKELEEQRKKEIEYANKVKTEYGSDAWANMRKAQPGASAYDIYTAASLSDLPRVQKTDKTSARSSVEDEARAKLEMLRKMKAEQQAKQGG